MCTWGSNGEKCKVHGELSNSTILVLKIHSLAGNSRLMPKILCGSHLSALTAKYEGWTLHNQKLHRMASLYRANPLPSAFLPPVHVRVLMQFHCNLGCLQSPGAFPLCQIKAFGIPWSSRNKQDVLCQIITSYFWISGWHTVTIVLELFMPYSLSDLLIYYWSDPCLLLKDIRIISRPLGGEEFNISLPFQIDITSAGIGQTLAALILLLFINIQFFLTFSWLFLLR